MAPRHRSVRELFAQIASLSKHEIGQFVSSLSEKESRILAAQTAKRDDLDDLTKQEAMLVSQGADPMSAIAALPKDQQDAAFAQMSTNFEEAISYGDQNAERMAIAYKMQLDYLHPKTTAYGHYLQNIAEALQQRGWTGQDIKKVREESQATVAGLLGCWSKIHTVLQSHERLIQTRWLKLTRSERMQILLVAWPDMPKHHRPDMEHYFKGKAINLEEFDMRAGIWPYINLEDLLKPKALLIFLNSRGRNHPCNFAYSDLELAPMFKTRNEFIALMPKTYTMDFLGSQNQRSYGAWIEWSDATKAAESIRAGRTVHYEHGSQILHIQVTIMRFLLRCTIQILQDVDCTQLAAVVSQPLQLTGQGEMVKRMEIIAREAPYRLPGRLDLERMRKLIGAQRSQAIDHAWALREDPGYFASTIETYREHRSELILDEHGNAHPHASDFPLYNKVARHMVTDAHCLVFIWDEILQRIVHVQHLLFQHSTDISVDKDLPYTLHEKLSELQVFVGAVMLSQVGDLQSEFSAAPPVRSYHYRANVDDPNLRKFEVRVLEVATQDTSFDGLLTLIGAICSIHGRDCFTTHTLVDELERLIQTDPRAKGLVSAHVAESLSRLFIFAECLHQLHLFQPWAHKIESNVEDRKAYFVAQYNETFKHWGMLSANYQKFEKRSLNLLCSPRDGKFMYPVHEHPSRAKVDQMRSAEAALDAFWKAANSHWLSLIRTTPSALVRHIMGERTLTRTAPWTPPIRKKVTKPLRGSHLSATVLDADYEHAHDVTKQITGGFAKGDAPGKSKTKTKGNIVGNVGGDLMPTPPVLPVSAPQAVFKVDKRSLKVFRTLFHSPDSPNQPGQIAWLDLLHAMISVGFGAEKLRSSAWHFTPPASIGERSIQLHEPHPVSKLPFVLARHYGRRLGIAYRWTSDSFELA